MYRELEPRILELDKRIAALRQQPETAENQILLHQLRRDLDELLAACRELTPEDRVYLARHSARPKTGDYIRAIFDDFFEQKGDRLGHEDRSILGGIALLHGMPVTVIGHQKGKTLEENMACNFGMPGPEGYRKALRLMEQAEKFGRPIITFIDTPGAYPGLEAETDGQSTAIARNLAAMSALTVPVVAVVIGEGGSGGALALGVANTVLMLENAVYSILSPEGFASILWKDSARSGEACSVMKLTAADLLGFGVVDQVLAEPPGGAQRRPSAAYYAVDKALCDCLPKLTRMSGSALAAQRYQKFRTMGAAHLQAPGKERP